MFMIWRPSARLSIRTEREPLGVGQSLPCRYYARAAQLGLSYPPIRSPTFLGQANKVYWKTFADQAVIAIENVRLFQELEARTRELAQSVGELKALGEVGQAVSSTLDLQTVLSTIVRHAVQLSRTDGGVVYEYDEAAEEFHLRASHLMEAQVVEALQATPVRRVKALQDEQPLCVCRSNSRTF